MNSKSEIALSIRWTDYLAVARPHPPPRVLSWSRCSLLPFRLGLSSLRFFLPNVQVVDTNKIGSYNFLRQTAAGKQHSAPVEERVIQVCAAGGTAASLWPQLS